MGDDESRPVRRRFLRTAGSIPLLGLAGCLGRSGGGEDSGADERPWEGHRDEEVPEAQKTCTSLDGVERNPDDLTSKGEASYQFYPQRFQMCANCRFFCPAGDVHDDLGACAIVEGRIRSSDWCALYQPAERVEDSPPVTGGDVEEDE